MIYRQLGTTGIEVSALGFGAMRLPMVAIGGHEYVDTDKAYSLEDHARTVYARTRKAEAKADGQGVCDECGACEEKCPQDMPVIAQLRETDAALGKETDDD